MRVAAQWAFLLCGVACGCIDVREDCGARGSDAYGDDTAAFQKCQSLAVGQGGGCVTVPPGAYPLTGVIVNSSHVHWRVSAGATLTTPMGWNAKQAVSLFVLGAPESATAVRNVSVVGEGGRFVCDCRAQAKTGQKVRGIEFTANLANFTAGNVRILMAYGDPNGPDKTVLNTNAMAMNNWISPDKATYHPNGGHVFNITASGMWDGYGLVQVQSAANILFEHLDGTGGVTLRLETGVQTPGSFVSNITARDIVCRDGDSAFLSSPHAQANGRFTVTDVKSYSCFFAVHFVAGYAQYGNPPGVYSNDSSVAGVVASFGKNATCDELCRENKFFGDSCGACSYGLNGNFPTQINYKVSLTDVQGVGFPFNHDYSKCTIFNRHHESCPYWPTP